MTPAPQAAGPKHPAVEQLAVIVGLIAFTGIAMSASHLDAAELGATASDPLLTVMKGVAALYAMWGAVYVVPRRRWGAAGFLLLAIHVAALASIAWSDAPRLTLFRALQLVETTLFALTFAARFEPEEQLELLAVACLTVAALTFVTVIAIPDTAIMTGEFDGAWRGLFTHKNQLGKFAVMSAAVFACLDRRDTTRRTFRLGGLVASVLLVLASTSKTALVSLTSLWLAWRMFRYLLRQRSLLPHATALGIVLAASATLLWIHAADIAEMLGRDLTLSGRTALWFAVIAFAIQRPLFGYGYAAFWRGMDGDSAYISLALHWDVPHAHNGWLDVGLDLGLLGIVLVGAYFAVVVARAFRAARERRGGAEVWPLLAVTLVFMANLTESSLLRANNLTWVILVLAGAQAVAVRVAVGDGALVPLPEAV